MNIDDELVFSGKGVSRILQGLSYSGHKRTAGRFDWWVADMQIETRGDLLIKAGLPLDAEGQPPLVSRFHIGGLDVEGDLAVSGAFAVDELNVGATGLAVEGDLTVGGFLSVGGLELGDSLSVESLVIDSYMVLDGTGVTFALTGADAIPNNSAGFYPKAIQWHVSDDDRMRIYPVVANEDASAQVVGLGIECNEVGLVFDLSDKDFPTILTRQAAFFCLRGMEASSGNENEEAEDAGGCDLVLEQNQSILFSNYRNDYFGLLHSNPSETNDPNRNRVSEIKCDEVGDIIFTRRTLETEGAPILTQMMGFHVFRPYAKLYCTGAKDETCVPEGCTTLAKQQTTPFILCNVDMIIGETQKLWLTGTYHPPVPAMGDLYFNRNAALWVEQDRLRLGWVGYEFPKGPCQSTFADYLFENSGYDFPLVFGHQGIQRLQENENGTVSVLGERQRTFFRDLYLYVETGTALSEQIMSQLTYSIPWTDQPEERKCIAGKLRVVRRKQGALPTEYKLVLETGNDGCYSVNLIADLEENILLPTG